MEVTVSEAPSPHTLRIQKRIGSGGVSALLEAFKQYDSSSSGSSSGGGGVVLDDDSIEWCENVSRLVEMEGRESGLLVLDHYYKTKSRAEEMRSQHTLQKPLVTTTTTTPLLTYLLLHYYYSATTSLLLIYYFTTTLLLLYYYLFATLLLGHYIVAC